MKAERWARIEELFVAASDRDTAERPAFLDAECGTDPELRREVESLLETAELDAAFLDRPLHVDAARVVRSLAGVGDVLLGAELAGARSRFEVLRSVASGGMGTVSSHGSFFPHSGG